MKAIIMAGGEGTRLRPLTCDMPKPMLRVMNVPVLEHIIELLKKHGIKDIAITLGYLPEKITEYFDDGSKWGVNINYYTEQEPLGTAGSIKNASRFVDSDFLVISGDALTDINLSEAFTFHEQANSLVTIILSKVSEPLDYGIVLTDRMGKIKKFAEKPMWSETITDTVNTGIYIMKKEVLDLIPDGFCDFSRDVFPTLLERGKDIYGFLSTGYWCDIGDISAYRKCQADCLDKKVKVKTSAKEVSRGIFLEDGAVAYCGAMLSPPVYLGHGATVKRGAKVDSYSIIGDYSTVQGGASVKRSTILSGVTVGKNASIRGALIGSNCQIGMGSSIYEQAVIGSECKIESNAVIKPNVKIWCKKTIPEGSVVDSNVVWGNLPKDGIFSSEGIIGTVNGEITPEFCARLGASIGSIFAKKRLAVCFDGKGDIQMLENAFISGAQSVGCILYDFSTLLPSVLRSAILHYGFSGGVSFSVFEKDDENYVNIRVYDERGIDIDRKKEKEVENLFSHGDYRRYEDISGVSLYYDYKLLFLKGLINRFDKKIPFKISVGCPSIAGKELLNALFLNLGVNVKIHEHLSVEDAKNDGSDIAFVLDRNGEDVAIYDIVGERTIANDEFFYLSVLLSLKEHPAQKLYVPVSASSSIESLAREYNSSITRTKDIKRDFLSSLFEENNKACQCLLEFSCNGVLSIVKILKYLIDNNLSVSALSNLVPKSKTVRYELECPKEKKSTVINDVLEENREYDLDLTDGIKINFENGWVLVLPDNSRPICKIIAEGYTEEFSQELVDDFKNRIEKNIKNNDEGRV